MFNQEGIVIWIHPVVGMYQTGVLSRRKDFGSFEVSTDLPKCLDLAKAGRTCLCTDFQL